MAGCVAGGQILHRDLILLIAGLEAMAESDAAFGIRIARLGDTGAVEAVLTASYSALLVARYDSHLL